MEGAKYNLIYEYYKCHILFGHLKQGDYLPTIEQVGNMFHVAPQTVRNALKKLQNDKLISVSPGRNTIVIHKTTPKEAIRITKEYYLARKDDMKEIYWIANLLLMPLYHEGCKRLTQNDLHQIICTARQENANIASISMFCCNIMMDKVNNRLVKSLFLDIVSFFQFPYIPSFNEEENRDYKKHYQLLLSSCAALDREDVFRAFAGMQALTHKTLQDYIEDTSEITIKEPMHFHWSTYRGKPQHCHTLAANIIHKIIDGVYVENTMLPSYDQMSKELSVSVNTARRTIALLRDMGVIHSMHGIGNQISFAAPTWKNLQRYTIQKNVSMAGESIEILLLSSNDIIYRGFPLLKKKHFDYLKTILLNKKDCHPLESAIQITQFIAAFHPSEIAMEIYSKLLEPILLVYPLLRNQHTVTNNLYSSWIEMMCSALDFCNPTLFSQVFLELLTQLQTEIEQVKLLLQSK